MRPVILTTMSVLVVSVAGTPTWAGNQDVTFVLHVVQTEYGTCDIGDPCVSGPATIEVRSPGQWHAVYLVVRNYEAVSGLWCAFEWGAGWEFIYGAWNCFSGWYSCELQPGGPGGPRYGTLGCSFDCIKGGAFIAGRMLMRPTSGCLSIIDPEGRTASVIDCNGEVTMLLDRNRGRICVGGGGYSACDPAPVPVDGTTWGQIKGQYGR
jgi:hypothetical protein